LVHFIKNPKRGGNSLIGARLFYFNLGLIPWLFKLGLAGRLVIFGFGRLVPQGLEGA